MFLPPVKIYVKQSKLYSLAALTYCGIQIKIKTAANRAADTAACSPILQCNFLSKTSCSFDSPQLYRKNRKENEKIKFGITCCRTWHLLLGKYYPFYLKFLFCFIYFFLYCDVFFYFIFLNKFILMNHKLYESELFSCVWLDVVVVVVVFRRIFIYLCMKWG